ncbi:MAG: hypothetical protein Fur0018_25500 [Anaerolineales bacterium]
MRLRQIPWKTGILIAGVYLLDAVFPHLVHVQAFYPLWLAFGAGLAVLWLWGQEMWPVVLFLAAAALSLRAVFSDALVWALIALDAGVHTALVWLGWRFLKRFGMSTYPLRRLRDAALLLGVGMALPLLEMLVVVFETLVWRGAVDSISIGMVGVDVVGSPVTFLFLMACCSPLAASDGRLPRRRWEMAAVFIGVLAFVWLVFGGEAFWPMLMYYRLEYFVLVIFVMLPFRYPSRLVFSLLAGVDMLVIGYTLSGSGPLAQDSVAAILLHGQLGVMTVVTTVTYCGVSQLLETEQLLSQNITSLLKHNRRLILLDDITRAAFQAPDEYSLLQNLADRLGELWQADGCYLTLWDEITQHVIAGAAYGPFRQSYRQTSVEPGEPTLTEAVLRAGQPIFVPDVFNSPHISQRIAAQFPARALLGIPLQSGQRWLGGALIAFNEPPALTDDDLQWATQVGAQISLALDKMQLYQRVLRELQREQQTGALAQIFASSLEMEVVLPRVLNLLVNLVGADAGALALVSEDGTEISYPYLVGNLPASLSERPTPRGGGGLAWRIVESRQYLLLDDYRAHVSAHPDWRDLDIQAFLGVPLMARDTCLGAVGLFRSHGKSPFAMQDVSLATMAARQAGMSIQNAALFQREQRLRVRAELLSKVVTDVNAVLDVSEILERLLKRLQESLKFDTSAVFLVEANHLRLLKGVGLRDPASLGMTFPVDNALFAEIQRLGASLMLTDASHHPGFEGWSNSSEVRCWLGVPLKERGGSIIGYVTFDRYTDTPYTPDEISLAETVVSQVATALAQARFFQETEARARQLELLYELSQQSVRQNKPETIAQRACELAVARLGMMFAWVGLLDQGTARLTPAGFVHHRLSDSSQDRQQLLSDSHRLVDSILVHRALRSGTPVFWETSQEDAHISQEEHRLFQSLGAPSLAAFSLCHAGQVFGIALVGCDVLAFPDDQVRFLQVFINQVAVALENARLFRDTRRHLEYLQALHTIDMTINASLDLDVTLGVLVRQISQQLGADAVVIYTLEPHSNLLSFCVGEGFRAVSLAETHWRLGQGRTGRVALTRESMHIANLTHEETSGTHTDNLVKSEGFVTYYGVPLIAKGQVKGVLEIYHRTALYPDVQWVELLNAVAAQAAIAMDNAGLFQRLERSNFDLLMAYDTTLEGWSRALELRDAETEGHSERVTEMTMRLAQAMGITGDQLTHIRHGALLHDIGKMGIPDAILYKPGPLTDEEWQIMRQHPVYAYQLLSPIPYLRAALDIPYCHHERWQGQGYPRGLKGEQIPLAARIFAVVDVWDALSKDRPYRKGWPQEKVRAYLKEQADIQFDPTIVDIFLRVLDAQKDQP